MPEPMGREVAIKNYESTSGQDAEKRFFREAALTAKLQHPNTFVFMIMEKKVQIQQIN